MWIEFRVSVIEHCQRFSNCLGLAIPARRMDHCFVRLSQNFPCGINKADVATLEALNTAFRQNFDNISPWHNNKQRCSIGATVAGGVSEVGP